MTKPIKYKEKLVSYTLLDYKRVQKLMKDKQVNFTYIARESLREFLKKEGY